MSSLPSKLFFRIGEVAGLVGVEPHVLRYWEREFRSIRPTKSAKGQRVYSRKDVENLLRVRDLLYRDGFTIAGAKKRLQRGGVEPDGAAASEVLHELHGREGDHDHSRVTEELFTEARFMEAAEYAEEEDEGEATSAQPESALRGPQGSRAKLSALRAEIEAFLEELEPLTSAERGERA